MRDLYARRNSTAESLPWTRFRVPEMKGTAAAPRKRALPATVVGWEGEGHSELHFPTFATPARSLASGQGEVDRYFRIYFDRFAVQQIWLIFPLLDGVERTLHQHRMPADQLQVFDGTILADLRS